jgi:DNA-directed RNA polymerase, beta'' subunit/160 kD subunit
MDEFIKLGDFVDNLADRHQNDFTDEEVTVELIDFEKEMKRDLKNGNGFIILDKEGLDKSKTVRTEDGIYSPKFGSIWGDENAFEELYSCKCGHTNSKYNLGLKCPKCGYPVVFKDKNVHMTGWFKLDNYKLIHPNIYHKLCSLIGSKRLNAILRVDWETETNGSPIKPIIDESTRNIKKYDNIGLFEFERRFDEICEFFLQKKKDKIDIYEFIMENREKVFTSCFPVIPLFLRPIVLGDEDFMYTKLNTKYAQLSAKFFNVNYKHSEFDEKEEKILLTRLYSIQRNYYYLCDMIMDMLNKKEGHIRNDVLGFKANFVTRSVITPLSGTKINEVHFSYLGFLEMYKPEILNTLCKLKGITLNEADVIWKRAQIRFDKTVYKVMEYIVDNTECWILFNRNPTLNYGSILEMKITKVKPSYDDLTISVPINVLPILAADFDGDSINALSLKDIYLKKAYNKFNPRTKMIISKNDGLFDNNFNLIKDQLICLHYFNTLGNHKIEIIKPPSKTISEIVIESSRKINVEEDRPKMRKVKARRKRR